MNLQIPMPFTQTEITRYVQAQQERDAALAQVEEHADPDWKSYALGVVKQVAQAQREFTSDTVIESMKDATIWTHDLRALGPVMLRAAKEGYIRSTEKFLPSARRHCTPIRVWASEIYRATDANQ